MKPFTYVFQIRFFGEEKFFGPGIAELLIKIEKTGSIRSAAAQMEMAYSKAWKMIKAAEKQLEFKIIETQAGGKKGGGSTLTPECSEFLKKYLEFNKTVSKDAEKRFSEIFYDVK